MVTAPFPRYTQSDVYNNKTLSNVVQVLSQLINVGPAAFSSCNCCKLHPWIFPRWTYCTADQSNYSSFPMYISELWLHDWSQVPQLPFCCLLVVFFSCINFKSWLMFSAWRHSILGIYGDHLLLLYCLLWISHLVCRVTAQQIKVCNKTLEVLI